MVTVLLPPLGSTTYSGPALSIRYPPGGRGGFAHGIGVGVEIAERVCSIGASYDILLKRAVDRLDMKLCSLQTFGGVCCINLFNGERVVIFSGVYLQITDDHILHR